ncbi:MAG: DNA polymerase III subunit epsilon [Rubrivivax sp.]|nr:DNA polymerase III subunit epsilon [Rubrivivax sp.]
MRQIFLDTETTGLSADSGDRVIEIGLIEMVDRRRTGQDKHWYLNPQRSSHPDAVRVHGLTDDFLADKPLFESVADEMLDYLAGAELVIHNASFDLGFLDAELARLGKPPLTQQVAGVVDTLLMAREMYPGKANSLDALCKRLEVDNTSRAVHGALLDAGLLAEVYIRLTRGQDSLVIEVDEAQPGALALDAVDLSAFELPVLPPSEHELSAHDAMLSDLDQASRGQTVWRRELA